MLINFYTDNEQKAPTVEFFLFTDHYRLIMKGMFIENNDKTYQVNSLQNTEKEFVLNAFIAEIKTHTNEPC